jgi:hypothetical protein
MRIWSCKLKFAFIITASLNLGCGKKANNIDNNVINQQPVTNVEVVKLVAEFTTNDENINDLFTFKEKVNVYIPKSIQVLKGNAGNQQAIIYFNSEGDENYFYCVYQGGASTITPSSPEEISKGKKYNFVDCYNETGLLGYIPNDKIYLEKNNHLELELLGADPRTNNQTVAEIEYEIF